MSLQSAVTVGSIPFLLRIREFVAIFSRKEGKGAENAKKVAVGSLSRQRFICKFVELRQKK